MLHIEGELAILLPVLHSLGAKQVININRHVTDTVVLCSGRTDHRHECTNLQEIHLAESYPRLVLCWCDTFKLYSIF